MKKILLMTLILISGFAFNLSVINAQPAQPDGSVAPTQPRDGSAGNRPAVVKLDNPIKVNSISALLLSLVDLAIFLGSIVAVLMFVYIGFKFVMAQGNESELKEAKAWFMYAVIGTALLVSSKVIVSVVQNTLVNAGLVNEQQIRN